MKAALIIFGVLAAIVGAATALFTLGEAAAIIVFIVVLGGAIYGLFAAPGVRKALLAGVLVIFVGALAFVGIGVVTLIQAFTDTDGPVEAADPVALASAQAKVDEVTDSAAFRLELFEDEMTAYVLNGLTGEGDNPIGGITLDVVDAESPDEQGLLTFEARFKSGGSTADGAVSALLENGAVSVQVVDVGIGAFNLPGIAEGALEDLVERLADFNTVLEESRADVQAITIGDDKIVIVGTQASTDLITADAFLTGLASQAASAIDAVDPPPERLGPGVVNSTSEGSAPFYVALGDSLAANVGVDQARDGYVSRFHNQLQERDGRSYGLRNFGISGETTGTMIRSGQLDDAVDFMSANDVAYVTIDIGANNLLGHLGSDDCSESLSDAACSERLATAFGGYDDDLALILERIEETAPDARVIFMQAYNPFSLGFGTGLEAESDRVLSDFNEIAAGVARDHNAIVADAFTPMARTAGATTHMLDATPDIHPVPIGFDILAGAILDALVAAG
ncbi:MAG: SGNH/GDSL hydrolase family protein [Acidimicrobiia bacterium]